MNLFHSLLKLYTPWDYERCWSSNCQPRECHCWFSSSHWEHSMRMWVWHCKINQQINYLRYIIIIVIAKSTNYGINCTYPVLLNNWFSWSHLFLGRQPSLNPNKPFSVFLKGGHSVTLPNWYTTWSSSEPPSLILIGLNAASKKSKFANN